MDIRGITARERLRSMLVKKMHQEVVASQAGTSDAGAVQPSDKDAKAEDLVETKVKSKQYCGNKCSAPGCKVTYAERSKQRGITFHSFPWSKPDLVKKWEHAMCRTSFKATVRSQVCSNHFTPDSFDRTGLRVRLKAGAVPTIFELPSHILNPTQHRKPLAESNGRELSAPQMSKPTTSSAVEHSYSQVLEPSRIQHRKPLAESNGRELSAPQMSKPTTSSAVEHSYSPVLEPSCKRLKSDNSANGTNVMSVESSEAYLQELQSKEGLHAANRLTDRHIQWNQQKMKVRLAAQTLSSSVADSLEFCQKDLCIPKFKDCTATVKFIRIIDRLFDIMNSRNPLAKGYKSPLFKHNETYWRPFLLEAIQYLKGLKLADGQSLCNSVCKTGAIGFIVSSVSIMNLFDCTVKAELHPLKYLLTYKLSQDHLELFFAVVRSRGGSNNNPSALHLRNTWKRLLTHHELKDVASGNCIPQDSSTLMTIASRIQKHELDANVDIESIINDRRYAIIDVSDHANSVESVGMQECPGHFSLTRFVENVIAYIAGFVVRIMLKKLSCIECKLALLKADESCYCPNVDLIIRKDRGGLVIPSSDVVTVCKITEMYIRQNTGSNQKPLRGCGINGIIVNNVLTFLVGSSVFEGLLDHDLCNEPLSNHRVNLMRTIAKEYTLIRLFHQCKTVTRLVQGKSCRSVLGKTVLFKGQ